MGAGWHVGRAGMRRGTVARCRPRPAHRLGVLLLGLVAAIWLAYRPSEAPVGSLMSGGLHPDGLARLRVQFAWLWLAAGLAALRPAA